MLQFQPIGFGQRVCETSLGVMAYYTPLDDPWRNPAEPLPDLPPLVFLHSLGGGSSAYEWSKVYPAFANDYRVLAPDLVGWGQSSHPTREYSAEDYFTTLTEFLEETGSPATVFASSLTAGITIRLAIQRPDLFQLLILVCPSGYSDFGTNFSQSLSAQITKIPGLNDAIYNLGAANEAAVLNFLGQFLFAQPSRITAEMVSAYVTSTQQRHAQYAALSTLKGNLSFDLSRYIGQLQTPTVMIWGENAWFNRPSIGQRLAKLNPAMIKGFHVIPDAGVLPHLECPAYVVGLAEPYLFTQRPYSRD
jgi:pimeloyl-ACP methyl ester carboxylesterase